MLRGALLPSGPGRAWLGAAEESVFGQGDGSRASTAVKPPTGAQRIPRRCTRHLISPRMGRLAQPRACWTHKVTRGAALGPRPRSPSETLKLLFAQIPGIPVAPGFLAGAPTPGGLALLSLGCLPGTQAMTGQLSALQAAHNLKQDAAGPEEAVHCVGPDATLGPRTC